jgi:hypothetical protein
METDTQLRTPEDYVRALKAAEDPPRPSEASKIEIARTVWDDQQINFPQKREFLFEFILSRLLKEKNAEEYDNLVLCRFGLSS